jgi:DedD protein
LSTVKPEPPAKADAAAEAEPARRPGGAYAVQVGALADHEKAKDLAARLRAAGYSVSTSEVATKSGSVVRVRVGGYATRVEAQSALEKLKGQGYTGIVAEVK